MDLLFSMRKTWQLKMKKINCSMIKQWMRYLVPLMWVNSTGSRISRLQIYTIIYLYYKSWNNWKQFLPRLGPPSLSLMSHLSGQKVWQKGGGDWFRKCFPPKFYYFLHHQFFIPISCTHILLSFSTHILFYAHKLTHNSRHFFLLEWY